MKKKIILSSILSLALCLSLIAGATFALFTSGDETNIAINSGKVEVVATIENLELYSPTLIAEDGTIKDKTNAATEKMFVNGGTATLDGAKLTLDKMTPGDKATFQIKIANNSNVAVLYRSIIMTLEDTGLFDGLNVTIGEIYDGTTQYSKWTPLTVDEKEIILECSVELPTTAGNEYQDTTCAIVFAVEAVQGNTATTDAVATIGETEFATLEGAISAVQKGQTIKIIRPGTYAPFTVTMDEVTIQGIVGETKAESTVIKNTSTANVRAFANDVKLDSLYIDDTTPFVGNWETWIQGGAITTCINPGSGATGANLTVSNCHIVGNGAEGGFAILYCASGLNFNDNTIENYNTGFSAMSDNYAVNSFEITGNTFVNVEYPINGYWGGKIGVIKDKTYNGSLVITDNIVDEGTIIVWDYAQTSGNTGVAPVIKNNSGDITYRLVWFDYLTETADEVVIDADTQTIVYQSRVAFDIPYADRADYVITNADGSALTAAQGNSTLTENIDGNAGVRTLATGDYLLVHNTGVKYFFTVTNPTKAGTQQYVTLDTIAIANVEDMLAFANDVNVNGNTYQGQTVVLVNNIDLAGMDWTPIGSGSASAMFNFNGLGHTISNFNVTTTGRAAAGLFGWYGGYNGSTPTPELTIQNLTIDSATVNGEKYSGALVGYVETINNVTIKDVTVQNSSVSGSRTGGVVGIQNAASIVDCVVKNTKVTGSDSMGEIVGYASNVDLIDGCEATDVTLIVAGQEALDYALENAESGATINLAAGTYTLPNDGTMRNKELTFAGDKDAVIDYTNMQNEFGWAQDLIGTDLTFDGLTVNWYAGEGWQGIKNPQSVTYKDCDINGLQYLYGNTYFEGCTLTNTSGWSAIVYGSLVTEVEFTDCTFNTGNHAVLLYQQYSDGHTVDVTLTNCIFNNDGSQVEIYGIEQLVECAENDAKNASYNLELNECTITGEGTKALWGNKNTMPAERLTITVDGEAQDVSKHPTAVTE